MKTAILLCGLPRQIAQCWRPFYDNLVLQMPDADVFVYTGESYADCDEFFATVRPKRYVVEQQRPLPRAEQILREAGYYVDSHVNAYAQQLYGVKRAWETKRDYEAVTGTRYDLVVRTRTDLLMLRPVTLGNIELGKINTLHHPGSWTVCSEFAVGPDAEMAKYCGLYDWILDEGAKGLPKDNPRLGPPADGLYTCDIILTTYLLDYHKLTMGMPTHDPGCRWPYDYYRIYWRHVENHYE